MTVSNADEPEPLPLVPFQVTYGSPSEPPLVSVVLTFIPAGRGRSSGAAAIRWRAD